MNNLYTSGNMHDRLKMAVGDLSYRELGTLTDTHPETVRRYMQGHAPSASFLSKLCLELGISGDWILSGKLPVKTADIPDHVLERIEPDELMRAVSNTMIQVLHRLDHLEHNDRNSSVDQMRFTNTG